MDKLFELIFHEVKRRYKSERKFYRELGITQRAWEKYKTGETNFKHIKLSTYFRMVKLLFTPYEVMLIEYAIQETNLNRYPNVIEAFHELKVKHAQEMLKKGGKIYKSGGIGDDERNRYRSINEIYVIDGIGNRINFEIRLPSNLPEDLHLRMPSGEKNRIEWFKKYFNKVVVK